jgi:ELWxxDGT repeat protein
VFFGANDPPYGNQLWRSDGTPEGTRFVTDTPNGPDYPASFTAFKGAAYFFAQGGARHIGLWRTDGTPAGTVLIQWVSEGDWTPHVVKMNDQLLFAIAWAVWRSDGTQAGTVKMVDLPGPADDLVQLDGRLFLACDSYERRQYELWRSHGSEPGTVLVHTFSGATYEYAGWKPQLTTLGSQLFFASDDGTHGDELWRSDGTPEGTTLVADINPGPAASRPAQLLAFDDQLFFFADDGLHGSELWKSDGTSEGTRLVRDICRGASGSSSGASGWGVAGSVALFAANDGASGSELWALAP